MNRRPTALLAAILGCAAGLGLLAAHASNAKSYLGESPEACINCHVMTSYYAGWEHSSHRQSATCNDCHVPHETMTRKLAFKMFDGARHSFMFTFRLEPQVMKLNPAAVPVVQSNCVRCHEHQIMIASAGTPWSDVRCWHCHRETPHGLAQSLSSSPHARRPALPSAGMPPPDGKKRGEDEP